MRGCIVLLVSLLFFSCQQSKKTLNADEAYFSAIKENDVKLDKPKPGDWLYDHPEKGQTFESYKRQNTTLHPELKRIYLVALGTFTREEQAVLEQARRYASVYFQREVVMLPALSDSIIPKDKRRQRDYGEQWLSPYIINSLLPDLRPSDAIACMAFTSGDLYPADDWNFVFGEASYAGRVGVTSIFRLKFPPQRPHSAQFFLQRLMNVATHEIGHMLLMSHCTNARCVMNGSNGMAESDASPNRACSECQRKLHWRLGYDNQKRLKELTDFFRQYHLEEDFSRAEDDLDAID